MWKFILLISINYKQNFMKRFSLILAFCAYIFTSFAHDFEIDGIYYNITSSTDKTVEVTCKGSTYDSYSNEYFGVVTIPELVTYDGNTYSVTSIGYAAFADCSSLTSVEFPNSVTSIGDYAFWYCSSLTSVELPSSVTSIGQKAFKLCSSLSSVVIPYSVTKIEWDTFTQCENLTSVVIPNSVTYLGEACFSNCKNLSSLYFLGTIPTIKTNAFNKISSSCKVYVPYGCKDSYSSNSVLRQFEIVEYASPEMPSLSPAILGIDGNPTRWESSRDGGLTWKKIDCTSPVYVEENPERGKVLYRILNEDGTYSDILKVTYYDVVPETIVASPTTDTKIVDESVKFTLDVIDDGYTYQWYHNGVAIEGATENSYEISVIKSADAGTYYCVVTNPVSSVNSTNVELTVNKCSQFISFPEIGTKTYGDADFKLPATTNKGLPIFYQSMDSDVASISGNTVTITGVGETVIVATQAGNADYLEADYVARRLIVTEYAEPEQNKELTISAAGYATLYLPIAVEIPSDVKVYIGETIKGKYVMLKELKDVIPANTGVVVKAAEGIYEFVPSGDVVAPITNNLFNGTNVDTYITPAEDMVAYVLSMVDGEVGMYRAKLNAEGAFLNNANKVYMELNTNMLGVNNEEIDSSISGSQLSKGFCFAFPETTNISGVKLNSPQTDIYYDLQGRKVSHPTRGMYILNGKKVFVK